MIPLGTATSRRRLSTGGISICWPSHLEARADDLVSKRVTGSSPGLAVLVSAGGRVLLRKGYGLADLESRTPIRPQTRFLLKDDWPRTLEELEQKG